MGGWQNKKVAILGLSFKPNTDDMREAPSLKIIPILQQKGASVSAYDPKANHIAKELLPEIEVSTSAEEAIIDADVTILLTEWQEFINISPDKIKNLMKGNWLIDTRNQFNKEAAESSGLNYIGIGHK